MKTQKLSMVLALGCMALSAPLFAAVDSHAKPPADAIHTDKDKRMEMWAEGRDALEKALGTGKDKAFYRETLEGMGYAITAVNADKADYLEYEIVKGAESYEVQVDFKDGSATAVDVTANVWKAPSTKNALKTRDYKYVYPATITANPDSVSERVRMKAWKDEKAALEKSLGIGHERSHYRPALEKLGYRVTSVNDAADDVVELEVVKGDTSYEVQVDFDTGTKKSTAVDVSTNMWETEATERARGGN